MARGKARHMATGGLAIPQTKGNARNRRLAIAQPKGQASLVKGLVEEMRDVRRLLEQDVVDKWFKETVDGNI